ncbi:MAG TPA: hypothetical protein PLN27_11850 [Acidobacteriota bacterium]|nr:hypothetical protein [Acidobacteriota bacterium]
MKNHGKTLFLNCLMFSLLSTVAWAQLPPSAQVLPAGFKLVDERNLGGTMIIQATKPNENFPKPHMDQGIQLEIMWQNNPAVDQILEILASQPEDPGGQLPGSATRDEPCGKERYRGGILKCRKSITPWIGGGSGPDLVTWSIGWAGKGLNGLVGVNVHSFYGSKETAMGWIDSVIPKITQTN